MKRSLVWVKPEGAELATVELTDGSLAATGTAIGGDPLPYRLEYELATGAGYVTTRLWVRTEGPGGWSRTLELMNAEGDWTIRAEAAGDVDLPPPGGGTDVLRGALDCDLGLSPLTNTMPVLRSGFLAEREPEEYLMAWVSVPDLQVIPSRQTYSFVRRAGADSVVNYHSPGFTEDIVFGPDGLVRGYPSIGRLVP